jgi:hypothetical protein
MLSPQSWYHYRERVPTGRSQRFDHDCGPGRTLKISNESGEHFAYCFRCNDSGKASRPVESLAERGARLALAAAMDAACYSSRGRPEPAIYCLDDWPAHARLWLFRAGLSRQDAGALGAYYHEPTNRVVLQLRDDFWVARSIDGRQPKYLSGDRPPDLLLKWGSAAVPTLCEDALSAYKVGKVAEGWPVMGTKVSPAICAALLQRGAPVNLWLDPDAAGQRASIKYRRQLQAYGLTVRNIVSQRDPKLHTLDEIRTILEHTA